MEKKPPQSDSTTINLGFLKKIFPEVVTTLIVTAIIGLAEKISQDLLIPSSILAITVIIVVSLFNKTENKRRKWLFIGSGIAVLVGFIISATYFLREGQNVFCDNTMTDIVITTTEIKQGDIITENDISTLPIPSVYAINYYFTDYKSVVGQVANVNIPEYSMLTKKLLVARPAQNP